MKDDLILKKYNTTPINGTYNLLEEKTFFGSKMMEVEDEISINNKTIQYYQYYIDTIIYTGTTYLDNAKNNGFQNYIFNKSIETLFVQDLVQLKLDNHSIIKYQQNDIDLKNNTRWQITINIKNILQQYLFYKIKESRTFKGLKYTNFLNQNINQSILDYINLNVVDRYKFDTIDFYVQYYKINQDSTIYNFNSLLQYEPIFDSSVELPENIITNTNVQQGDAVNQLSNINLIYAQIKPSTEWKFDYYFNIHYKKI